MYFKHFILSNRGQVSMEIGILVAAAVAVSALASYFYIKNVKDTEMDNTGKQAVNTTKTLTQKASQYCNSIETV